VSCAISWILLFSNNTVMKTSKYTCHSCGASLDCLSNARSVVCKFCKTVTIIETESDCSFKGTDVSKSEHSAIEKLCSILSKKYEEEEQRKKDFQDRVLNREQGSKGCLVLFVILVILVVFVVSVCDSDNVHPIRIKEETIAISNAVIPKEAILLDKAERIYGMRPNGEQDLASHRGVIIFLSELYDQVTYEYSEVPDCKFIHVKNLKIRMTQRDGTPYEKLSDWTDVENIRVNGRAYVKSYGNSREDSHKRIVNYLCGKSI